MLIGMIKLNNKLIKYIKFFEVRIVNNKDGINEQT